MKKILKNIYKVVVALVVVVVISAVGVYLVMFLDTNSVMTDVRNVMSGNVSKKATAGLPMDEYNEKDNVDMNTVSVKVKLHRIFVLHDFRDGYMWVDYSVEGHDKNGKVTYGSWDIPSRWKIHRDYDGKWQIVKIAENP